MKVKYLKNFIEVSDIQVENKKEFQLFLSEYLKIGVNDLNSITIICPSIQNQETRYAKSLFDFFVLLEKIFEEKTNFLQKPEEFKVFEEKIKESLAKDNKDLNKVDKVIFVFYLLHSGRLEEAERFFSIERVSASYSFETFCSFYNDNKTNDFHHFMIKVFKEKSFFEVHFLTETSKVYLQEFLIISNLLSPLQEKKLAKIVFEEIMKNHFPLYAGAIAITTKI